MQRAFSKVSSIFVLLYVLHDYFIPASNLRDFLISTLKIRCFKYSPSSLRFSYIFVIFIIFIYFSFIYFSIIVGIAGKKFFFINVHPSEFPYILRIYLKKYI